MSESLSPDDLRKLRNRLRCTGKCTDEKPCLSHRRLDTLIRMVEPDAYIPSPKGNAPRAQRRSIERSNES